MIELNDKYTNRYIKPADLEKMMGGEAAAAYQKVVTGSGAGAEMLGWRDLPADFDKQTLTQLKQAAQAIRSNSDILVVIGIGGSYLGARAVIEALQPVDDPLTVIYAGKDLSPRSYEKIQRQLAGKDWSICVISKSGTTTEPAVALRILRTLLAEKYGAAADSRIYAISDAKSGTLHDLAVKNGWQRFIVPDDIGGRFSVLTPVGLLPIAAAGIDIDQLLQGAADQARQPESAVHYAALRNLLYRQGFSMELLADFQPCLSFFNEWWKQLFGESEGRNGLALFPASVVYTTDLHSLGQMIQDGKRVAYETFIHIKQPSADIPIPDTGENDGVQYLAGKSLDFVNQAAYQATVEAHYNAANGGVPVITLSLPDLNAYHLGSLLYFMMLSCAISAYILDPAGNPFDQPGVEYYKQNMFRRLGK